ncbi:MAG: LacI family DNA-binding transcriptional regulator [Hyphomicrobiales bacterium]|nr:LacI family DNA-binding transcriptional regulator [Hyphomicrobiales bacterium]
MKPPRARRGGGRPTIADVARLAGVGAITVSRALREPERVSESLRQQIQRAVDELDYVPDPNARALASARAEVFGVLVPSLTNNVFAEVVRGVYDSLSDTHFRVQLGNTHYSAVEEVRLLQLFLSQRLGARMDPRSQRRLAGYRAAMEAARLFDPDLITTTPVPSSVTLGSDLFRGALAKMPSLDGVFCNNDDLALGVLFECHRASIAVPDRIGICGFNDFDMMQIAYPSVTSVRTHRYEIGRQAVVMAREAIAGMRLKNPIVDIGFELKLRDSTNRL